MKLVKIVPSDKRGKKLMAVFDTNNGRTKTIHFGARGMDDYTITKNKEQRTRYLSRHSANEHWSKPDTAGSLSRYILWGDSTSRQENIASFRRRFNL
jgi:hypothetical protein